MEEKERRFASAEEYIAWVQENLESVPRLKPVTNINREELVRRAKMTFSKSKEKK